MDRDARVVKGDEMSAQTARAGRVMPASRTRRRAAFAVPLAVFAAVSLAGSALAGWSPTHTLRELPPEHDLQPEDLSANGMEVVAGWREEPVDSNFTELRVRESRDAGTTFGMSERITADPTRKARDLSLDSGGGSHWAAWTEKRPTAANQQRERVFMAGKPYGTGIWDPVPVSRNADIARFPTIAHTTGRLFVSYQARVSGAWRVMIQHARTDEGIFGAMIDMGSAPFGRGAPHLDATDSRVHLAWSDGNIRLRRATLGGAPDYPVAWLPTQDLGAGQWPVVVAGGSGVAVFFYRDGDTYVRVSQDHGATFAAARRLLDGDPSVFVYIPTDAAISGARIVLSAEGGGDAFGQQHRLTSTNGGLSWTAQMVNDAYADERHVAFTVEGSAPTLAEAFFASRFTELQRVVYHRNV